MKFTALDPDRVVATVLTLRNRIVERFPTANLGAVADDLHALAKAHAARSDQIRRPAWSLRLLSGALLLSGVGILAVLFQSVPRATANDWHLATAVQTYDAGLSLLLLLGASAVFTLSLEQRRKRQRCLVALHELRAMAHVVDMHQLTKDPDRLDNAGPDTPSSPARTLTRFEMIRYLDYCSEMLSLMGKLAALYIQGFPDPAATAAVDDIENLTTGLAAKIWQKIMILQQPATVPGHPA